MQNRDQIYASIKTILAEMFELNEADIQPTSKLYEDLDIDSIDAVDLLVKLKETTGKQIKAEDFKTVRTVNDIVEAVAKILKVA